MTENENSNQLIEKTIKKIHELPTLPLVYSKLTSLIYNPKTTARSIATVMEEDPALTTKILKIINSAF